MWLACINSNDANPLLKLSAVKHLIVGELKEALSLLSVVKLRKRVDGSAVLMEQSTDFISKAEDLGKRADISTLKLIVALIFFELGAIEKSFEAVNSEQDDIDCQVLMVQLMVYINRVDAARVRVEELKQRFGEDARVQLVDAVSVEPLESVHHYYY
jgi:hypothetical protein